MLDTIRDSDSLPSFMNPLMKGRFFGMHYDIGADNKIQNC